MSAKLLRLVNGRKIPMIGLGTWESKDPVQLETVLDAALELGYRHIDTAIAYGNEGVIGKVLNRWTSQGKVKRDELFVTTKLFFIDENAVEISLKQSLQNLGLDYVDLYLLHFPVNMKNVNGAPAGGIATDHVAVWKKMENQVDAGRTKAIGLSNFNKRQVEKLLASNPRIKPANNQVENHVYLQQQELVKYCQENDVSVTAYCPLGSPGYNNFLKSVGMEAKQLPDMLHDETITKIAANHKKTNAQIMLRYQIERNIIVIPKTVTTKRLKENIDIFDFTLTPEEMRLLNELNVGEKARICDWSVLRINNHEEYPFGK